MSVRFHSYVSSFDIANIILANISIISLAPSSIIVSLYLKKRSNNTVYLEQGRTIYLSFCSFCGDAGFTGCNCSWSFLLNSFADTRRPCVNIGPLWRKRTRSRSRQVGWDSLGGKGRQLLPGKEVRPGPFPFGWHVHASRISSSLSVRLLPGRRWTELDRSTAVSTASKMVFACFVWKLKKKKEKKKIKKERKGRREMAGNSDVARPKDWAIITEGQR